MNVLKDVLNAMSPAAAVRLLLGILFGFFFLSLLATKRWGGKEHERDLDDIAGPFTLEALLSAIVVGVFVYGIVGFVTERFWGMSSESANSMGLAALGLAGGACLAFFGLRWCSRAPERRKIYREILGLDKEEFGRRGIVMTDLSAERTGTVRLDSFEKDGEPEDVPARAAPDVYARCKTLAPGTKVYAVSLKDEILIVKPEEKR